MAEMPQYQSHKKVWALKIKGILSMTGMLIPEDDRYGSISLTAEYIQKHNPKEGGYYVVYEDGYESYSPAEPFEKGNKLISSATIGEKSLLIESLLHNNGLTISNLDRYVESQGLICVPKERYRELIMCWDNRPDNYIGESETRVNY